VTELRLSAEEFNGHRYLSLRLWERDQSGEWRPTRMGVSVRISKCARLAEALADVARQQSTPARPSPAQVASPPSATGVDHDHVVVDVHHVDPDQHESDTPPFDEFRGDQP
jgi:hypothetical protein